MKITIQESNSQTNPSKVIVLLEGRLDTIASQEHAEEWEQVLSYAAQPIVLNMQQLEYVASSGLRMLFTLRREVTDKGGELVLQGVTPNVMQILKMSGCKDLFNYAE